MVIFLGHEIKLFHWFERFRARRPVLIHGNKQDGGSCDIMLCFIRIITHRHTQEVCFGVEITYLSNDELYYTVFSFFSIN